MTIPGHCFEKCRRMVCWNSWNLVSIDWVILLLFYYYYSMLKPIQTGPQAPREAVYDDFYLFPWRTSHRRESGLKTSLAASLKWHQQSLSKMKNNRAEEVLLMPAVKIQSGAPRCDLSAFLSRKQPFYCGNKTTQWKGSRRPPWQCFLLLL